MGSKGIVASTAAMAVLLQEGIGDTIRVSLTPEPGGDRTREVIVAQEMLQTMGLRSFAPLVIACPGCGRTTSTFFQELADRIQSYLRAQMPVWRERYPGVENMHVAVMGCVVNGPGESKHANIGISLPGSGENPVAPVFVDGVKTVTLKGEHIARSSRESSSDTCPNTTRGRVRRTASSRRGTPPTHDAAVISERRPATERNATASFTSHESPVTSHQSPDEIQNDTGGPRDERRPAGGGPPVAVFRGDGARSVRSYGYREIRMPIVERTELFVRGVGEVTDIVEKEMYTFVDALNGES